MAELDISPAARADLVDIRIFSLERFGAEVTDRFKKLLDQKQIRGQL